MSFAQASLVQRIRNLLNDNPWATTGSAASSSSVVAVPDGTKWDEGAILEFQDTGEQCWVQSVSSNNLTCLRGYNGTTPATHASGNVLRDPFFTYARITEAAELCMQELWPYCYKRVTATVTPVAGSSNAWYDLASDYMALIQVTQVDTASNPDRVYIYGARGSGLPINVQSGLPTTLVTSGTGILFPAGFATTATTVRVDYAAKITATTAGSPASYSDLSDGILVDLVTYGAAARLTVASDVPRATQEDIGMGDSSVQVGMRSSVGRQLYQTYLMLRNQYWEELRRTMPLVGSSVGGRRSAGSYTGYGGLGNWN